MMNLEINLIVAILWGTAVIAYGIAVFAWRRRRAGEWAQSFTVLACAVGFWSMTYGFEVASMTLSQKVFWAKVGYLGIVTVPVAWFIFAMQYTSRSQQLSAKRVAAFFIVPFITLLFVFTNEYHGQIWSSIGLDSTGPVPVMDTTHGIWFWIHSAYSYLLIIGGSLLMLQMFVRYPKAYRRQNATLLIGSILPLVANAVFITGIFSIPNLDFTTLAFTISALLMANAIFRYQLFDMVPVARRTAVDHMRDGMIVLDNRNRVLDINPAALKLFQREASAMIGQNIADFLQDQTQLLETFRNVTETNTEVMVPLAEKMYFFDLHISPLHSADGGMNGRLIVFYDVTDRKEAEIALARARDEALDADKFKTELLARVSHELRTPLSVILGYTEMLQEGIFGELTAKQLESTHRILESTAFLTRQVNELLDLSRLDVRELRLNNVEFAIADLLKRVQDKMQVLAENKGVSLKSIIDEQVPAILVGDPDRIEQILLNLIGNGIKFSHDGTVTQCVFMKDKNHWAFKVSDEGIGIPIEMQQSIFEPFKQVDGSLTRVHSGTGLGLAIVKQMVGLMNGELYLESKVSEGSSFTVVLPLLPLNAEFMGDE